MHFFRTSKKTAKQNNGSTPELKVILRMSKNDKE